MAFDDILTAAEMHYSGKVTAYGSSFKGVDWGSREGQNLRFEQLLKFIDVTKAPSINDYGCGYGALLDVLDQKGFRGAYCGYDISAAMIETAKAHHRSKGSRAFFTSDASALRRFDYTLTSGVFNVKLDTPDDQWAAYLLHTLDKVANLSRKGFVFNALSAYTPAGQREGDLFYADPPFIFDYCMKRFAGGVSLSHDYALPDFTVFVRLNP